MKNFSLIMFDVDGVLLDSLTPHLKICEDKNLEYRLGLSIPNADRFGDMVRRGVKISPMEFFFQSVGFSDKDADRATEEYKENFMRDYAPKPFPEIHDMLDKLREAGLRMGIATSNVRSNVVDALGSDFEFFQQDCIFTKDDPTSESKSDALLSSAKRLNIDITETLYVGDQPSDWTAASEAHANFLGVSYGWGISEGENEFPVVDNVMSIADYILSD